MGPAKMCKRQRAGPRTLRAVRRQKRLRVYAAVAVALGLSPSAVAPALPHEESTPHGYVVAPEVPFGEAGTSPAEVDAGRYSAAALSTDARR